MEKRFEIAVVPCVIEKTAPDKGYLVSRFQFQGEGGGDWFGLWGAGGGLEVDVVLGQFGGVLLTLWSSRLLSLLGREGLEEKSKKRQECDEFHGRYERW